jgi:hypothetical protein
VQVGLLSQAPSLAAFSLNIQRNPASGISVLVPFIVALSGNRRLVICNSTLERIFDVSRETLQNIPE